MPIIKEFKRVSRELQHTIVLPEGFDTRTVEAASKIYKDELAKIIILGKEEELLSSFEEYGINIKKINEDRLCIISPNKDIRMAAYTERYYGSRKAKGMTEEEAIKSMSDPLFFAAMLVKDSKAGGMVAGASNTTAAVLKAALRVIGPADGIKTVSSCFLMVTKMKEFGVNGVLLFADSAVNPDPNDEMLADIVISTAENCRTLLKVEPIVAMLSFSTKGSSKSPSTEKIVSAVEIVKKRRPDIIIDGEMQLDAALIKDVAEKKAKGSNVAGKANVLIFPNLDAANIGYKLVERFSEADAIGPIMQGLKSPVNDLSRGCSADDIVNVVAITSLQVRS